MSGVPTESRYYEDIPTLIAETDKLFEKITAKWPEKTKLRVSMDKIVKERGWEPSLSLIKKNFPRVLRELNFFFVPKVMRPGPVFVFPIRGLDGTFEYAQTKPLEGSVLFGKSKYRYIGARPFFPLWLGNHVDMLRTIIQHRTVVVVEGPFDLLACRLLCPDLPIICPLTKKLVPKQVAYLRILGVKNIIGLFDNEFDKKTGGRGAGATAMDVYEKKLDTMNFTPFLCPGGDASEALKFEHRARQLKALLKRQFSSVDEYYEE